MFKDFNYNLSNKSRYNFALFFLFNTFILYTFELEIDDYRFRSGKEAGSL